MAYIFYLFIFFDNIHCKLLKLLVTMLKRIQQLVNCAITSLFFILSEPKNNLVLQYFFSVSILYHFRR